LSKSITVVTDLIKKDNLSDIDKYVLRERIKMILRFVGIDPQNKVLFESGTEILKDKWPFKVLRLRKLSNESTNRL
jgi:hypothetical protein